MFAVKPYVLAGCFLLVSPLSALAGDRALPPQPEVSVHDWSGAYLGANIGYGWGGSEFYDGEYNVAPGFPPYSFDVDSDGLLGGVQAGYNWQRGKLLYGLEADFGYLNLDGSAYPPPDPTGMPYDTRGVIDGGWYAGLGARLGYAHDRTLFFVKAGGVYTDASFSVIDDCSSDFINPPGCGPSTYHASKRLGFGYLLGAGIEHAINDRWSVKLDYSYMGFGKEKASAVVGGDPVGGYFGQTKSVKADLSVHTVKAGINVHF